MMAREPNLPPSEEELLDRLVDDELDEAERRELLKSLEQKPDGWRRCALAFLEAQCWKRELRHLRASAAERAAPASRTERPSPSKTAAPRRRSPQWGATALAMAASFLLALGLSYQMRFGGSGDGVPGRNSADLARTEASRTPLAPPGDAWRVVTLNGSDPSGNPQSVRLPAQERRRLDPTWWQGEASLMPPEMLQALKDSGHEIQQSRQVLPVPLRDGRKLMVPVDQVDVHYVGNPEYQ